MHRFFVNPELLAPATSMTISTPKTPPKATITGPDKTPPKATATGSDKTPPKATITGPDKTPPTATATAKTPTRGVSTFLPTDLAHQVRDVLRLKIGEELILLDNSGDEVLASITKSDRSGVEVQLLERHTGKSESPIHIILCQGLLKSARFEWILEKGTELGVATFAPMLCRRSMSGLEDAGPTKIQRWQRIIQEAAEQCGRSRLPQLLPIRPLIHALNDIPPGTLALMPWEEEQARTLHDALITHQNRATSLVDRQQAEPSTQHLTVILFIGPEGGLMAEEVTLAQQHGVQVVTLGSRIFRAETAALATIANIMYHFHG